MVTFPPTFKTAVSKAAKVLNAGVFSFVPIGCLTSSPFNFYIHLVTTTLFIISLCLLLLVLGHQSPNKCATYFHVLIAITYLILPTVTTTIFGVFSCDYFDDDSKHLRADLSINCNNGNRGLWLVYEVSMVMVFPVGVVAMYFYLLLKNRAAIMEPVEIRSENEKLRDLRFLFDPYKPEFWYFEVVETLKRLMMTGVLSTINPGSFSQYAVGLIISILVFGLFCMVKPYNEARDNYVAILTSLQTVLILLFSFFMKTINEVQIEEGAYDTAGMDMVLILGYVLIVVLFVMWAYQMKDDTR
ncbi:hypothetical protein TrLO_g13170 [Triparma laevis f. longispina]|uniref:Uncharacterized protein n=1 Tax=Triparma laevis f. longispina TaxID=1714387 RepID=A0A9W7CJN0_9STRA|nr:hypothetical protein TrLO_g13170 [Triparma laevis f. longispina]